MVESQVNGESWTNRLASLLGLTSWRQPGFAMALGVLVICAVAVVVFLGTRTTRPSDSTAVAKAGRIEGTFGIKPDEIAKSVPFTVTVGTPQVTPGVVAIKKNASEVAKPRTPFVKSLNAPLPGESNYLREIATLKNTIDARGENSLRPGVRSDYERNVAAVDQAIDATRKNARENPGDKESVAFLYAQYQTKIELLNAVADQSLVASR